MADIKQVGLLQQQNILVNDESNVLEIEWTGMMSICSHRKTGENVRCG